MSLPFTSVVSYHTNPMTCGVAKFSAELAKRLGVPFEGWNGIWGDYPLLSLKASECERECEILADDPTEGFNFGLFWHDAGEPWLTKRADVVFYADPSLGSPGLWCPSLITPRQRPVRLFSFGMAGRLQPDKYKRVRELLDAAGKRYHLRVSVGLHEGTNLSDATQHFDALREIMGPDNVTILGILSDDAVSEELSNAEWVLAFFEKGARANNTTIHAALEHGKNVISNLDGWQPTAWSYAVLNIHDLESWPPCAAYAATEYDSGGSESPPYYNWDNLITAMRKECDRSKLPTAS